MYIYIYFINLQASSKSLGLLNTTIGSLLSVDFTIFIYF